MKKNRILLVVVMNVLVLFSCYLGVEYMRTGHIFHIFSTSRFVTVDDKLKEALPLNLSSYLSVESAKTILAEMKIDSVKLYLKDESRNIQGRPPFKYEEIETGIFNYKDTIVSLRIGFFNNRLSNLIIINHGSLTSFEDEFGKSSECDEFKCFKWESRELEEQMIIWDQIYS